MPLSVAEVLTFDILCTCRVVAGERNLQRRDVRSVSVIEVPVDEFVREGDLVLTTAMGVGQDASLFANFVRDVALSGAAALLIALGPHAQTMPAKVMSIAEELGLPLIVLPWELRFSEVSQVVLGRLLDDQHAVVRESLALQQRLTRLVVDGADLTSLARALATMLSRPVVMTDMTGRLLARGGGTWLEGDIKNAIAQQTRTGTGDTRTGPEHLRMIPELGLALAAIEVVGEACGYIATPVVGASLTAADQLTLQHAVTAAALCFLQRRAAEETTLRLRDDFVWSLAAGDFASQEDALARGRLLGYDLDRRYAGIYGKFQLDADDDDRHAQPALCRQRITSVVDGIATHDRRAVLMTVVGDAVVAFIEVRRATETLDGLVDRLVERLQDRVPGMVSSWGIGSIHTGFEAFHRTYREARTACLIGTRLRGVGSVTHISQTGVYRMLLAIGSDPKSRQFRDGYLRALLNYDTRKGMDLLGTLETYLETQGNASETARRHSLHRQSLLYRLQRIEELTGGDLSDPQHRFALELSTHLYRLRDVVPQDAEWSHPRPVRVKPARLKSKNRKV